MEGWFDIHNHSIYGVDDGAKSLEESLEMLKLAYEDGIRKIILTPHAHYKRGKATPEEIREKVTLLQERIKEACPELCLYPGSELYYDSDMPDKIECGEVCRLADSDYVLVEFSPDVEFSEMKKAFHEILCLGVAPILAHVERYACLYEKKDRVAELREMGISFQTNAAAILGEHSGKEKRFLKRLFQNGDVGFVATDAHDTKERRPALAKCAAYLQKKYGFSVAKDCLYGNPLKVLNNEPI